MFYSPETELDWAETRLFLPVTRLWVEVAGRWEEEEEWMEEVRVESWDLREGRGWVSRRGGGRIVEEEVRGKVKRSSEETKIGFMNL